VDLIRVTDDTTKADLAEAITNLAVKAKHEQHIVERYSNDEPTAWSMRHRAINAALDYWQRAE
jgi:hypothetical protein